MTEPFRCGTHGLPAAEKALVRTLLKLYQHGASDFRWVFAERAPYDALLIDASLGGAGVQEGQSPKTAVLTLGPAALAGLPDALARPLRSELLEAWLLQTQRRILDEQRSAVTAAPEIDAVHPAPDGAPPADPSPPPDNTLYKLMRWPPAAMLRNDPSQIRLATVLSRRAMKTSDLAQLAQRPLDTAQAFVAAMRSAGLLTTAIGIAPVIAPGMERQATAAAAPAQAPRQIERSLMSRIRHRLGL